MLQTLRNLTKTLTLTSIGFAFLSLAMKASAQISNPVIGDLGSDAPGAANGTVFGRYFAYLWNTTITVGGFVVIIYFIWAAFEWITAGSDSSKLEKARMKIVQASIGLIILVSSFTIISFVSDLFFADQYSILKFSFTSPQAPPSN